MAKDIKSRVYGYLIDVDGDASKDLDEQYDRLLLLPGVESVEVVSGPTDPPYTFRLTVAASEAGDLSTLVAVARNVVVLSAKSSNNRRSEVVSSEARRAFGRLAYAHLPPDERPCPANPTIQDKSP